jgi:competence ComEA-like helix-hairpin-helix protein
MFTTQWERGHLTMKIKWYEALILGMTVLCAIIFLLHYFAFVKAPGIWISSQKGDVGQILVDSAEQADEIISQEREKSALSWLNDATQEELEQLPGINSEQAQAILEERARLGGFTGVEQLLEIDGFTQETVDQILDAIAATNETGDHTDENSSGG